MQLDLKARRMVGVSVWGVGLVVALVWNALDSSGAEGVGYGFAPAVEVAALETGRVLELSVHLHDAVSAEQVVVRMDPALLLEEREIASAALLAVQHDQSRKVVTDARRFSEGVETSLVSQAKLRSQVREDQALVQTLRERMALEEDLASTGASSSQAVEEWRRQISVVEARIGANQHTVALAGGAAAGAQERQAATPVENEWEVVTASRVLEQVDGRITRLDLHAGVAGQVTWIYRNPGDVVPAGTPVLQVRQTGTRDVVAFLATGEVMGLQPGDSATVRRSTGQVIHGKLVSVGSGPQPLPVSLWRMPTWPEYGVPVRLQLDAEIAPDEPVTVRL